MVGITSQQTSVHTEKGKNDMGEPIYTENWEEVGNEKGKI